MPFIELAIRIKLLTEIENLKWRCGIQENKDISWVENPVRREVYVCGSRDEPWIHSDGDT